MEEFDVQVGLKVWVKPSTGLRSRKEPFESTIIKVGKKYFYLDENSNFGREYKFELKSKVEANSSNYPDKVYPCLQAIQDEEEQNELWEKLSKLFNFYTCPYSLKQLRLINQIIEPEKVS